MTKGIVFTAAVTQGEVEEAVRPKGELSCFVIGKVSAWVYDKQIRSLAGSAAFAFAALAWNSEMTDCIWLALLRT